ncbi:Tn3 family transposase [Endozoicomonas acroporae]|uniref:Tn3 family transposase n=1 Tax=Endozoicomonas acroporae TaxID=1701104 RepID=UPI000C761D63
MLYDGFGKWLMFGGDGVIAENLRHEQQKIIKYNQLVSNLTILHNVQNMTRALKEIASEGVEITTRYTG